MYLPNSNKDTVICEAYVSNYDHDDKRDSWGYGVSPIRFGVLSGKGANPKTYHYLDSNENAVYLGCQDAGVTYRFIATVNLVVNHPTYTFYAVFKLHSSTSTSLPIIVSNLVVNSSLVFVHYEGNTIRTSYYNSCQNILLSNIDRTEWFILALKANGNQIVNNKGATTYQSTIMSETIPQTQFYTLANKPLTANTCIAIGGEHNSTLYPDTNLDTFGFSNLLVRYVGVTNVFESDSVISQNMQNLASEFL